MKLSPDTARNVCAWSPVPLDDHSPARGRFQSPSRPGDHPRGQHLAETLFAPALSDDLTPREAAPPPGEPEMDEPPQPGAAPSGWLANNFNSTRMMEDCCESWVPSEFTYEPVGADSTPAGVNVETIREAALSVARAAVMETIREQAEQILNQARGEAAEIVLEARRSAAEEQRRAQQQGLLEARAQTESMLQMISAMAEETHSWQANMMRRSERLALMLVKDIAARLFGDGFALDPATLSLAFERALIEAKSLGDLRVRVHPDDLTLLGELWPAHQTALRGQRIEMIPDLDIQRGGCFIDGQFGSVDGRLDAQLRVIRERLDQELADSERPEHAFTPLNPEELTS